MAKSPKNLEKLIEVCELILEKEHDCYDCNGSGLEDDRTGKNACLICGGMGTVAEVGEHLPALKKVLKKLGGRVKK